jgi:hypothetical protein
VLHGWLGEGAPVAQLLLATEILSIVTPRPILYSHTGGPFTRARHRPSVSASASLGFFVVAEVSTLDISTLDALFSGPPQCGHPPGAAAASASAVRAARGRLGAVSHIAAPQPAQVGQQPRNKQTQTNKQTNARRARAR